METAEAREILPAPETATTDNAAAAPVENAAEAEKGQDAPTRAEQKAYRENDGKGSWPAGIAQNFEAALTGWIAGIGVSKTLLRFLAETALSHFKEHGDTSKIATLYDAMVTHGRNYVRPSAFKRWLADFAPITMEGSKFLKDRSKKWGIAPLKPYEDAFKEPFWHYAPDLSDVTFSFNDVVKDINRVIKKYHGDRFKPESEEDAAMLDQFSASLRRATKRFGVTIDEAGNVAEKDGVSPPKTAA